MKMKTSVEVRCIVCHLVFCCADCRWKHEQSKHQLQYDCPICRGFQFLCNPKLLNQHFIQHLTEEHLPLKCHKCNKILKTMTDLAKIDECVSISELIDKTNENTADLKAVDAKFNTLLANNNNDQDMEAIVSIDKLSKTAVITPIVRKKHLVDYESSEDEEAKNEVLKTPYAKLAPKTPRMKKREMTPHVKKRMLMRQKHIEEFDEADEETGEPVSDNRTTPSGNDGDVVPGTDKMTTPTSHLPHLLKLAQAVTTSTPTHAAVGNWSLFTGQGADSPLSEIENGGSPAQSTVNEESKVGTSSNPPKLKSIIMTGSRVRLGSADSSEKQVTFQDSVENSYKTKKVKFAEDTIFEQEPKVKRVFRKPKRMLTPGPQKPKHCINPRFQALLNRFESNGMTLARTPKSQTRAGDENTPPVGDHTNMAARAINFKEDSPIVQSPDIENSKDSNELFRSCVDSPAESKGINNAITALTANIAHSLQNCLTTALKPNEEEEEIQFKFVITKRKVCVKRIAEEGDGGENSSEIDGVCATNKENIWSTVAKAVRTVFWGERTNLDATTPHRSYSSSDQSSATKRKFQDMSDNENTPHNHKRQKYEGRLRGRPPLRRCKTWVSGLRSSKSAEQHSIEDKLAVEQDDGLNQSF